MATTRTSKPSALQGGLFDRNGQARRRPLKVKIPPPLEHDEQAALVTWARATARLQDDPDKREALELFHAIPNGAKLTRNYQKVSRKTGKPYTPPEALRLIAEGLTKGIEDLCLNWPLRNAEGFMTCAGFYIEMKRRGEKPREEQERVMSFHRRMGYRAGWFQSARAAAAAIVEHMKLERYAPLPAERG